MKIDWKDLVTAVAPKLGMALGGPLGGIAARAISQKLLGREEHDEKELAEAVLNAKPEDLKELKMAEMELEATLTEAGVDMARVAAEDRASARRREVETGDETPRRLAWVVLISFFVAALGVVMLAISGVTISAEMVALIGTVLGYASAKAEQVVAYYFGSSAGSKRKTELMRQ